MIETKLVKCDPADPHRCQSDTKGDGQCPYLAEPESKFCIRHGGNRAGQVAEKKRVHDYRLQQFQERVTEFAASDKVTNLAGEIGILRLLLEQIWNQCQTQQDLVIFSSKIADLVMKVERLVSTFDKMTHRSSNLLDKSAALVLAGQIVEIIGRVVDDPHKIDQVSSDIIDLVAKLAGKEMEE